MYCSAFAQDPFLAECLAAATELRGIIINRRRHLERRPQYWEWLTQTLARCESDTARIQAFSDYVAGKEHNPTSVAYVLEILFGLAAGSYPGGRERFIPLCELLPQIIDCENGVAQKRLLLALRVLNADPELAFIPRWILGNPPAGKEALFRRRQGKLGLSPAEKFAIDWSALPPRKTIPFKINITVADAQTLIRNNFSLLVHIAKQSQRRGLDLNDLIQEGSFGLIRAARTYIPAKGPFAAYAGTCIRRAIQQALVRTGRPIKVPAHARKTFVEIPLARDLLTRKNGRPPTQEEIAAFLSITVKKLRMILANTRPAVSLEEPAGPDDDRPRMQKIPDENSPNPETDAGSREAARTLYAALGVLPEQEQYVLTHHYGLNGIPALSLKAIGQAMNPPLSPESVRQIKLRALERLRSPLTAETAPVIP
jgi:RNA polymerase primary sigma factor